MIFILSLFVLLTGQQAGAHIVGASPWCLANSPVHYECFFEDRDICLRQAEKRSSSLERWECVSYPMDFRNIPRSGETPLKNEPLKKSR